MGVADPACRTDPLVGERRRHPNVDDREVRLVLAHRGPETIGILDRRDHVVSGILEEATKPFPEQDLVLGDHDSPGSSAVTTVPSPSGLSTLRLPPRAATRSVIPPRPE